MMDHVFRLPLRRLACVIPLFTLLCLLAGCGGGGGSKGTPVADTITGTLVQSMGGTPVAGSTVTLTGEGISSTVDTGDSGNFTFQPPDGTYTITATQPGYATSVVQDLAFAQGEETPPLWMIQTPIANPDLSTAAPSMTVGVTNVSDIYTVTIDVTAANAVKRIDVYLGHQSGLPDLSKEASDRASFTWNMAVYPPPHGASYLLCVAYDMNNNRVARFVPILSDTGDTADLIAPPSAFARAFTFPQDMGYTALRTLATQTLPQLPGLRSPMPSVMSVPQNSTIYIQLSWLSVPNADGYRIYRAVGSTPKTFSALGSVIGGGTVLYQDYDPTLTPGETYTYRVVPYNNLGTGRAATTPSVTVLDRFTVTMESPANGAVNVSRTPTFTWQASRPVGTTQAYQVYVKAANSTAGASWVSDVLLGTSSVVCDTPLAANTVYEWELGYCWALGSYNSALKEYLAYSFASPTTDGTQAGANIFTTLP